MQLKKKNGISYKTIIKNTILDGFFKKEEKEPEKEES